ncbi:ABC transporter ATP-binding protein [Futiania mangrovi]|uniref:ABC transporter ATP-binding protein n=1 Tax=Futiania mangrovi TaxID=2959716 RepID=A0A9J6PC95_9PROT|nr:ABC transporter ATP-binding protein [Futiania mangrovii]MCP1335870.1 ABC transporter ATP-binding protein [Futiania mangrovii]
MLRAENLVKTFGALEVTKRVSIHVPIGVRHAIIGPNGAGKTTLFNLIAGELQPSAGRILIGETDVTRLAPDGRARLGLARSFQKNNLFPRQTVRENLVLADIAARGYGWEFWPRLSARKDAHARAAAAAERVGLADMLDRTVSALSYGAQRQLEVGLALVAEPKILLLDEPTSGMSPEETARMLRLVDDLPRDLAVLLIEHDMDLVFAHADRITVLNYGEVLMEGTPEEVRGSAVVQETYLGGEVA